MSKDILSEYKVSGDVFDYFRIPFNRVECFFKELEKKGYDKDEISNSFFELEHRYKRRGYPIYWKNIIMSFLKEKKGNL